MDNLVSEHIPITLQHLLRLPCLMPAIRILVCEFFMTVLSNFDGRRAMADHYTVQVQSFLHLIQTVRLWVGMGTNSEHYISGACASTSVYRRKEA